MTSSPCPDGYCISQLDTSHKRDDFSCGTEELDRYIKTQAGQNQRKDLAVTYVLLPENQPTVLGFYSLASAQVPLHDLPSGNRITRHPLIPVTLLARLAVDMKHRGRRLGEALLLHALHGALRASDMVGSYAVVVDAKDQTAKEFYMAYKFIPLITNSLRLFLPMHTIRLLFSNPEG